MIDADADFVAGAVRADIHLPLLAGATEHIGQRPETFERIAELSAAGGDIVGLIGDADRVIQALFQRGNGEPSAIILHA
jgi:hypothetical protein